MNKDIQNVLWNLADAYRGLLFSDRLLGAVVRMIFVKYVTDNYLYADTRDEMRYYADVQKAISNRDVEAFTTSLIPILDIIDKKVNANGILVRLYSTLSDDLLGLANKKKNYSIDQSKSVLDIVSSIDLDNLTIDKEYLLAALEEYIYSVAANSGKFGGLFTTSPSINNLVSELLRVNNSDSYMDFACGYGLSALKITHSEPIEMYLSDINEEAVQMAFMLLIIAKRDLDKVHVSLGNVFELTNTKIKVSKMFVDFPLNTRIDIERYEYRQGTVLAIRKMIDFLKENGSAIITCHSSMLFTSTKEGTELRNYLLSNGYLQAVISLPPVMTGTTININLLLFSKKKNQEVVFVDASKNDFARFSNNARGANAQLTNEGIERIATIINKREVIPGVSALVGTEQIYEEQTLVPAAYISVPANEDYMSMEEISKELDILYERLRELNG